MPTPAKRTRKPSRTERLLHFHAHLEGKGPPAPIEWVCWTFTQAFHCVPSVALRELNISPGAINAEFFALMEEYRGYESVHAEFKRAMAIDDAQQKARAMAALKTHPGYTLYARVALTKRGYRRLAQWTSTNSAPSSRS